MKTNLIIFLLLVISLSKVSNASDISPKAIRGVLDLRELPNPDHFIINLNGEWEFYWKKMLHPHDFKDTTIKPVYYGDVPSYWTDYPQSSVKTEKFGYATYRLTILLPAGFNKAMGIDLPVFDSSYDIYLNNKYLGGNGTTGKSEKETEPEYRKNFFRIIPDSDSLSIIINVSNYHHRRGGFWLPVKLGTFAEVQKQMANSWAEDWAAISMLIGFSVFFLFFFLIAPEEKIMGSFSIATIGLALRPLFTSNFLILNLINISWVSIIRFEYFGLYLLIIGWAWFVLNLYPTRLFRIFVWIVTILFLIAFLFTLILPVKLFSYVMIVYYPSIIILMVYLLYKSFIGALRKNGLDIMYLFAFLILLLIGLHDIGVSLGRASGSAGYLLTNFIVFFVFIQAAILLFKWVKISHEKERLKMELEYMNRNLEIIVDQRTRELIKRNDEIVYQNEKIELQNKQLSDTIHLKNKIFSLIAHDLRGPVVNILYMLNLLKEKEYKEKYDTYANSSIQYAQQVINLLENMLVWGRGQEDKLKFAPEKRDLADIVLTNLSIFKDTADKKEINLNFTQVGSSMAFFDKDLLDIIIRNLLSNAVKFTPRGGRISILLKNKEKYGEAAMLKICDNGVGISEEKQKKLFTTSEVESSTGTEDEKGTGFGLKLCHELILINNGTISLESKPGEGTCFIITLPVDKELS
jgi:signal transduction histidine kinase